MNEQITNFQAFLGLCGLTLISSLGCAIYHWCSRLFKIWDEYTDNKIAERRSKNLSS